MGKCQYAIIISVNDLIEEIEVMGQEDEKKGIKAVKEISKRDEKIESEKQATALTKLSDRHKNTSLYRDSVKNEAKRRIGEYSLPQGFKIDCTLTSKGLAFGYRHTLDKMWFMKGMLISQNPVYDLAEVDKLINEALDEITRRDEIQHTTAGGIVI